MKRIALFCCLLMAVGAVDADAREGEDKMIKNGSKVKFNYVLKVDGEVVDQSGADKPFEYVQGEGKIINGLESRMEGLKPGEKQTIQVPAAEAYGKVNEKAFQEVPKSQLPPEVKPEEGAVLGVVTPEGKTVPVKVAEVKEESIVLNFNHPLAGKDLTFEVNIVEVE